VLTFPEQQIDKSVSLSSEDRASTPQIIYEKIDDQHLIVVDYSEFIGAASIYMVTWTSAMQTLTVCRGAVKYPQVRSSLEGHTKLCRRAYNSSQTTGDSSGYRNPVKIMANYLVGVG
jgi:hypothetical protein